LATAKVLTSLGIQGFKALFDASLSLGPFTLIIGRNGSGKSSAIEAIQWLRDATFLGVGAATSGYVDFVELLNRRSNTLALDVHFQRDPHARPIHYTLRVGTPPRSVRPIVEYERCVVGKTSGARTIVRSRKGARGPANRWIIGRGGNVLVRDGNELGLKYTRTHGAAGAQDLVDFLERAVFLRLSPTAIAAPSRSEHHVWSPLLSDDGHDLASLLLRMPASGRGRVAERLRAIFPAVEALDVRAVGNEHRFTVRERMRSRGGTRPFDIPSSLLSEGMRRLVAIFALLELDPPPSLLVIEEIENGLDPWTLEQVLDALREVSGKIQIVLTTHSPFLLDHVRPEEVIHVRRAKGDTTYEPVAELDQVARYAQVLAPGAMYLSDVFRSGAEKGNGDAT
jgi:predicted ATPase